MRDGAVFPEAGPWPVQPGTVLAGPLPTGHLAADLAVVRDGPVNLFLVQVPGGLVCIDAGWRRHRVRAGFRQLGLDPAGVLAVFLTHGHWDHAWGTGLFPGARVHRGPGEGGLVSVNGVPVRAIPVPGHTADSMAYLVAGRYLFTGDALRLKAGRVAPGHPWLSRDPEAMLRSIARLAGEGQLSCVLTGHTGLSADPERAFGHWPVP